MANELETLRTQYAAFIATLPVRYPAQRANVAYYERQLASAKLGKVKRSIEGKGAMCTLKAGEHVLAWPASFRFPSELRAVSAWAPSNPCEMRTDSSVVEVIA